MEADGPHLDIEPDCARRVLEHSSEPRPRAVVYDRLGRGDDELGRPDLEDRKQNGLCGELLDVERENKNAEVGQASSGRSGAGC